MIQPRMRAEARLVKISRRIRNEELISLNLDLSNSLDGNHVYLSCAVSFRRIPTHSPHMWVRASARANRQLQFLKHILPKKHEIERLLHSSAHEIEDGLELSLTCQLGPDFFKPLSELFAAVSQKGKAQWR
jgi:hypothetical protein